MKTKVTLTRVFKKEVEVEIDLELTKNMNEDEIQTYLIEQYACKDADDLFDKVDFEQIGFEEDALSDADTDRFDIYDDNGVKVYGGHL